MWRRARIVSFLPFPTVLAALWLWPIDVDRSTTLAFDATRAWGRLIEFQQKFPARLPHTAPHRAARDFIGAELTRLGYLPRVVEFQASGRRYANVLAEREGQGRETLVVGAHYDTLKDSGGAADNAAGVATLLEIAHVFAPAASAGGTTSAAHRIATPPYRIVFAFWDGEERGLLGSRDWVLSAAPDERRRVVAALSLDTLGTRNGRLVAHTFSRRYDPAMRRLAKRRDASAPLPESATAPPVEPRRIAPRGIVEQLLLAARRAGCSLDIGDPFLSVPYQVAVRLAEIPFGSDDAPFLLAGVPAAFLSDSSFTLQYAHYHRPTDTPRELDPARLANVGRTVEAFIRGFAAPSPPDWDASYLALGGQTFGALALWLVIVAAAVPRLFQSARRLAFGHSAPTGATPLSGSPILSRATKTLSPLLRTAATLLAFAPAAVDPFFFAVVVAPAAFLSALPGRGGRSTAGSVLVSSGHSSVASRLSPRWLTLVTLPFALAPISLLVAAKLQFGAALALDIPWWAMATWSLWLSLFLFRRRA